MTIFQIMPIFRNPARSAKLAILLCAACATTSTAWAQTPESAGRAMPPAGSQTQPQVVSTIVAVVNNEVITSQELDSRMRQIERQMQSQRVAMPPRAQLQKQVLERLIVIRAQTQLAKQIGIRVDDLTLDRAIAKIAEQNKMTLPEFRTQLEREGIVFSRFREEIREEIIMQRLREREVGNKIQITESEIDNYLAADKEAAKNERQEINLAQILVRIPENASAEQIAQRRQRAEEAVNKLREGNDFAKIAAAYSDAGDSLTGGELGWRTPERLPQLFVDAVANVKQGDLALIKSANGFHILKLLGRRSVAQGAKDSAQPIAVQQTRARHILIKVNQIVSAADARRKLLELKERLDNNAAKFEDLAKSHSNDGSASKGGELGWVYPGDTVPEFERAMDALQPGQISEPVESPFGFHLIQVLERKVEDVSKERQRLYARQVLRERKLEEATEDWLRQLRDRAYVEYRLDENSAS